MFSVNSRNFTNFIVAGINYRKADTGLRGQFSINNDQYSRILEKANGKGLSELFIISTCNRTEIYGFSENANQLIELLCSETIGDALLFNQIAYIKKGAAAIEQLFKVGAGLDSQILGDYEIIGQIKAAVKFSKEKGFVGTFSERLVNSVLQSSKAIKNETELSGGIVSVSFAAVQYILKYIPAIADKKILIVGTGKMGRSACKNIVDYLRTKNITLVNRSSEKAVSLAEEMGLAHASLQNISLHLSGSDIIIVATNAAQPAILSSHFNGNKKKWIIDLTVPSNVEASVKDLPNISLINIDELSKLKDETLAKREAEIPKAKQIIAEHIFDFTEWYEMRKYAPVLKAVKTKLKEIQSDPLFIPARLHHSGRSLYAKSKDTSADQKIQRVINGMASKMKVQNQDACPSVRRGCFYIEAINEFIA
ncbi:MAG: glutamyl-tRNA reductase [Bacteroidetes bacterium]|nr:glutamyl-tRNA reductase [Bacteroidota bacterium]MBS1931008.1 glutamyl-tRNA reductase [Bacteroidota bacterium]